MHENAISHTLGYAIELPGRKSPILGGLSGPLLPQSPLETVEGFAPTFSSGSCGRREPLRPQKSTISGPEALLGNLKYWVACYGAGPRLCRPNIRIFTDASLLRFFNSMLDNGASGRSGFRAGFRPDSIRESLKIGPRRPAGVAIWRLSRLEAVENLARKPDFRPGSTIA